MTKIAGFLLLSSILLGCGGSALAPEEAILGTWKLNRANDQPVTVDFTLIFERNGSYTFINRLFDGSQLTTTGTWSIAGNTLSIDDQVFTFRIDEDDLIMVANDGTFIYRRQAS